MLKQITTEGFIADKQLVRKLGKVGILLSYYIDCYNFYADESGVFYRSREQIYTATSICANSQDDYEEKLIELGLIIVTEAPKRGDANRITIFPENIILYRDNAPDKLSDTRAKARVAHAKLSASHANLNDAHAEVSASHAEMSVAHANLRVNERIPTDERTEITTDVPTDTQLTDVKRWILNNNVPTSSIINQQFPKLTEEQITTLRNEAVDESFYL